MVLLSTVGSYPKQNWGSTSSISSIQKQNLGSPSSSTYPKQKFGSSSGGPSMVKPTTVIGGVSQPKPPVNNFGGKPTTNKGNLRWWICQIWLFHEYSKYPNTKGWFC